MKSENSAFSLQLSALSSQHSALSTHYSLLKSRNGFTLLEVVVAMAIVGLGVVTLLELFSASLRLGARSSARTDAITYARQAMDAVLSQRVLRDGQQEGSFAGKYRWAVTVAPAQEEASVFSPGPWELKEVTLQMTFPENGREKKIELRTVRLVKVKGP